MGYAPIFTFRCKRIPFTLWGSLEGMRGLRITPGFHRICQGLVEFDDYADVVIAFGYSGSPGNAKPEDMNYDGLVDFTDYATTVIGFGSTYPSEPPVSTPEPTSCILLLSSAGLALIRSKGRKG